MTDMTGRVNGRRRPSRAFGAIATAVSLSSALLLLNFALTFHNWWPTPLILPALSLSLEFLILTGAALAATRLSLPARQRALALLAAVYTALVIGHYFGITLPALFGRPISLYWDGRHVPSLLVLAWQQIPWWQSLGVVVGTAAIVWIVQRLLRWALTQVADRFAAASRPARRLAAGGTATGIVIAASILLAPAPPPGHEDEAPWLRYLTEPVSVGWYRQIDFALTAASPRRLAAALPPSPRFSSDLAALRGNDLMLIFLESYGATAFDNPGFAKFLAPPRQALTQTIAATGRHVVSAFVRSPTFGGGSWLAHASLLSGIDLSDPGHYALLMTTQRPTLVSHLRAHGYDTTALMPGIRSEWAEGTFYGFDMLLDSRAIGYRGPEFGFWRIPDQFSLQRFLERRRDDATGRPQFVVFPTVNSHIPFGPVPPYQSDWNRLAARTPFEAGSLASALNRGTDWLDLGPAYQDAIGYAYRWLDGLLQQPAPRDELLIVIGDHQPAASVSGRDAGWDVPVHLITRDAALAERFIALGFRAGIEPARPTLGRMSDLTPLLLSALAGDPVAVPAGDGAAAGAPSRAANRPRRIGPGPGIGLGPD
ncbi:MAG: sulfatase-like hydrolase/transferase [Lautropia sp.]